MRTIEQMRTDEILFRKYAQAVEEQDEWSVFSAGCSSIFIFIAFILVPPRKQSGPHKMKEKS